MLAKSDRVAVGPELDQVFVLLIGTRCCVCVDLADNARPEAVVFDLVADLELQGLVHLHSRCLVLADTENTTQPQEGRQVDVSILLPWRPDGGIRDRVFYDYVLPKWQETGADICVGEDDPTGPFNCSRAQNRAFRQAKHDLLFMIGADTLPLYRTDMLDARLCALAFGWVPLFSQTGYYTKEGTEQILSGADPDSIELDYVLPFCTGPVALTRDAYVATGGMDERFSGWGYEDAAFRQTLAGLFGAPPALPSTARCLWHEVDHRIAVSPNEVLMRDYTPLTDPVKTQAYLDQRGSFL